MKKMVETTNLLFQLSICTSNLLSGEGWGTCPAYPVLVIKPKSNQKVDLERPSPGSPEHTCFKLPFHAIPTSRRGHRAAQQRLQESGLAHGGDRSGPTHPEPCQD